MVLMVVDIHKKNGIKPDYDIYIGRKVRWIEYTYNSKWCNPQLTLEEYELHIRNCIKEQPEYFNLDQLEGQKLGCWCITTKEITPLKCHGQILMKLLKEKKDGLS